MSPTDMQAILAVYGMCTEADYHMLEHVGMNQAPSGIVVPTIATSCAGDVWAVRAPPSTLGFWLARMDDDDAGVDGSSELAKHFIVAKYPGYCPTLRTGYDSGPDAIRVVVALHRFLAGVPTKLPNATSASEVHVLREGGIAAHNTRLVRNTSDTNIYQRKGVWHSMPSTSVHSEAVVDDAEEAKKGFGIKFECVREIEQQEEEVTCLKPLR